MKPGPKRGIKAAVWKIFEQKGNKAVCKLCKNKKELSYKRSSTKSLRTHAQAFHKSEFEKAEREYQIAIGQKAGVSSSVKAAFKVVEKYKAGSTVILF